MNIKDKFAAFLRRLASKISPEYIAPAPQLRVESYDIRRVAIAFRISRYEEKQAKEAIHYGHPDALNRMREEYKQRIAHSIVAALWERGIIDYSEFRDPDTNELQIRGSLFVGIHDNKDDNPFND